MTFENIGSDQSIAIEPRDIIEMFLFKYNEIKYLDDFIQKLSFMPLYSDSTEGVCQEKTLLISTIDKEEKISDIVFSCLSHFSDIEDDLFFYIKNYDIIKIYIDLFEYLRAVSYVILNKKIDFYEVIVKAFGYISVALYDLYEQNKRIKRFYDKLNLNLFEKALNTEYIVRNKKRFIINFRNTFIKNNKKNIRLILKKLNASKSDAKDIVNKFMHKIDLHPVFIYEFLCQTKKEVSINNSKDKILHELLSQSEEDIIKKIENYIYI